jgi:hypothetical protein
MKVLVYVLFHNDETEARARKDFGKYSWVKLHRIQSSKYCESIIFPYLLLNDIEWKTYDYVGIITYSFTDKQKKSYLKNVINSIHANIIDDNIDVIGLHGIKSKKTIFNSHPGIEEHLRSLIVQIGAVNSYNNLTGFYNNYWIAKVHVFRSYLRFFDIAHKLIENNPLLNSDSGYKKTTNQNTLISNFGYPYYTWHPFICERLICIFCAYYKLRVHVLY